MSNELHLWFETGEATPREKIAEIAIPPNDMAFGVIGATLHHACANA